MSAPPAGREDRVVAASQEYTILRAIGEGGMGTVHLVRDPLHPHPMALKFLQAGMTSETRIAAFKREFAVLADLHHPHVCRVYDFGFSTSHQQYFFTAEFVEGEGLYRAMRQASLDDIELVILQILSALDFIHTVGLIHYDVKGANILVSRVNGALHTKLVDFGVTVPKQDALKEIAGTLYYMAPELLYPNPQVDQRVDLYSFGVVCYHLLTGMYPYEVHSVEEARAWHLTQKVDFSPLHERGVPEYLCHLVERLLSPNPADRFSSAGVMINYLQMHSGHAQTTVAAMERAHQNEGPLIGRQEQLTTLTNALQRIRELHLQNKRTLLTEQEGHSHAYLITGARGTGKSRLLKELKQEAQLLDFAAWHVDCEHAGCDLPQLLAALPLAESDPPLTTPDTISTALLHHATTQPCCYLFNNLDRAAPIVQKTVYTLLGQLYSATLLHNAPPLLVVVTLTSTAQPLQAPSGTPVIELAPLTRDQVYTYLETLLGASDDLAAFHDAVWNFSHGVPLLMVEAAKRYHTNGAALPESIEQLYESQIARLDTEHLRALLTIALLQEPADEAALQTLLEAAPQAILQHLVVEQLIRQEGTAPVRFRPITGALSETLLRIAPPPLLHAAGERLYRWALQQSPANVRLAAQMAPYASDPLQVAEVLLEAAAAAERDGAAETAAQHLSAVIALLDTHPAGAELWTRATRKLATARLYQGQYQTCEELLTGLIARTGTASVDDLKMLGLIKRAQRQPAQALPLYDQALALLPHDPENPTYLFLLNERAQALFESGQADEAIALYQQSLHYLHALPPDQRKSVTNNNLGAVLARLGKFDEAIAFYREKLATFAGEKRIVASVHAQLGAVYQQLGDTDHALEHFCAAWNLSREIGTGHNAHTLLENIITNLTRKSAYSEALRYAQISVQMRAGQAAPTELATSLKTLASLYLQLGLPDVAARYLTQAMRLARKSRSYQLTGWIHIMFGYLYKDLGRLMEALNSYEEAIALGQDNTDQTLERWGCYGAADLLVENGELSDATQYYEQLSRLMTNGGDHEFQTRFQLLSHKMTIIKHPHPDNQLGPALLELARSCLEEQWLELRWEAEYLVGIYHHKRDEMPEALEHMRTAYDLIKTLAEGLSEEYRDHFRRQRARARVAADLKTLARMQNCSGGSTIASTESSGGSSAGPATLETIHAPPAGHAASATPAPATLVMAPDNAAPQTQILFDPQKTWAMYEREILEAAITYHSGNLEIVAHSLGWPIVTLLEKMEMHGLG